MEVSFSNIHVPERFQCTRHETLLFSAIFSPTLLFFRENYSNYLTQIQTLIQRYVRTNESERGKRTSIEVIEHADPTKHMSHSPRVFTYWSVCLAHFFTRLTYFIVYRDCLYDISRWTFKLLRNAITGYWTDNKHCSPAMALTSQSAHRENYVTSTIYLQTLALLSSKNWMYALLTWA